MPDSLFTPATTLPVIASITTAHPLDLVAPSPQMPPRVLVLNGALVAAVAVIEDELGALPEITDTASCERMNDLLKRAATLRKDMDAGRAAAKAPAQDLVTAVDSAARPFLRRLETVEKEAKEQINDYIAESRRKAAEAQAKALAEARAKAEEEAKAQAEARAAALAAGAPAPTPVVRPTEVLVVTPPPAETPTVKMRKRTIAKVVDESKIPREYWTLNTPAINQAVLREGKDIPGVVRETIEEVVA